MKKCRVLKGCCLDVMAGMENNCVDAVVTDPPYFNHRRETWDCQWANALAYLEWMGQLCTEWKRILRPNGSLYVFASPQMAGRVECKIRERFNVLNSIIWVKETKDGGGMHRRACKEDLRSFFPQTERIVFAEHHGADNIAKGEAGYIRKCDELRGFVFEPLRAYLAGEMERAGHSLVSVNKAWQAWKGGKGGMSSHWFTTSQWALPTAENYQWLRDLFNGTGGEYLRREYEDLRREYEDLRRPFSVTADVPYTDVWKFETVKYSPGKHVCEKPLPLMRHIIAASTKPGAVVLDCFSGSGATGVACVELGRNFIGIEKDELWVQRARKRIAHEERLRRCGVE